MWIVSSYTDFNYKGKMVTKWYVHDGDEMTVKDGFDTKEAANAWLEEQERKASSGSPAAS